ncbi:hypothetical protein HNP86_001937 [Methanococcus maripaludis]|uniref:Uncharacterized protein n=1 Tax=Methanococcus maripaludis TaxID=39152 RepID=A0A7J9NVR8_METMI|nr:hypothetical protein [Methanococcus maripaludis]MBA2851778.1 hypothetical protein [Methanococcus maripaludis]
MTDIITPPTGSRIGKTALTIGNVLTARINEFIDENTKYYESISEEKAYLPMCEFLGVTTSPISEAADMYSDNSVMARSMIIDFAGCSFNSFTNEKINVSYYYGFTISEASLEPTLDALDVLIHLCFSVVAEANDIEGIQNLQLRVTDGKKQKTDVGSMHVYRYVIIADCTAQINPIHL